MLIESSYELYKINYIFQMKVCRKKHRKYHQFTGSGQTCIEILVYINQKYPDSGFCNVDNDIKDCIIG